MYSTSPNWHFQNRQLTGISIRSCKNFIYINTLLLEPQMKESYASTKWDMTHCWRICQSSHLTWKRLDVHYHWKSNKDFDNAAYFTLAHSSFEIIKLQGDKLVKGEVLHFFPLHAEVPNPESRKLHSISTTQALCFRSSSLWKKVPLCSLFPLGWITVPGK